MAQAQGDDLQQLIANRMTQRVIDVLETIEIDKQQSQFVLQYTGLTNRIFYLLVKSRAIEQLRQSIALGHELQAGLRFFTGSKVAENRDIMRNRASRIVDRANRQPSRIKFARLAPIQHFALPKSRAFQMGADFAHQPICTFIRPEHTRNLANRFLSFISGNFAKSRINRNDARLRICH